MDKDTSHGLPEDTSPKSSPRRSPSPGAAEAPAAPAARPRRRLLRWLIVVVAAVVALVALAPTLLSLGVVRPYVLAMVNRRIPVKVDVDDYSLSWFGSQKVRGLSVAMPDEKPFVKVGEVALEEGLLGLLRDHARIGRIRITGTDLWAGRLARAQKELIPETPPPQPPTPPGQPRPPLTPVVPEAIEVETLTVHARDVGTLRVKTLTYTPGPDKDTLRAEAEVEYRPAPDPGRPAAEGGAARGTVSVQAEIVGLLSDWRGPEEVAASGSLACANLPLAALGAIGSELGLPVEGDGTFSADAIVSRTRTGDISARATCEGANLRLCGVAPKPPAGGALPTAPGAAAKAPDAGDPLKGDTLALATLRLQVDATYAGRVLTVKAFDLKTPVATAQAAGTFGFAATGAQAPTGKGSATLALQVAGIARMLPNTLGLHKDLVVEGGTITATVAAASDEKASSLKLDAGVTGLRGTRAGKAIALSDGRLILDLDRERTAPPSDAAAKPDRLAVLKGLRVNQAEVAGAFGSIKAAGRLESLALDADLRLAAATEEVGRFVDLKGYGTSGNATAHIETKGTLDKGLQLSIKSGFTDLVVHLGAGSVLKEPRAALAAQAGLAFDTDGRLKTATVSGLKLDATTATVEAGGALSWAEASWIFDATAQAGGQMENLAAVASVAVPLALPDAGPPKATAAAATAADWRRIVKDLVASAAGAHGKPAAGRWTLDAHAKGNPDDEVQFTVALGATDLGLDLAKDARWEDKRAGVEAGGSLKFGPKRELVGVSVENLRLEGADSRLDGKATAASAAGRWTINGEVAGEAEVPRVARLAQLVLPLVAEPKPPAAKAEASGKAPGGVPFVRDLVERLAQAEGSPAAGRLTLRAKGGGDVAESVRGDVFVGVKNLVLPPTPKRDAAGKVMPDEPLRIESATVKADGAYAYGKATRATVNSLEVAAPGLALKVEGPGSVTLTGGPFAIEGNPKASVTADLATLLALLGPLHLVPEEPKLAGNVDVQLAASPGQENRTQVKLAVVGRDVAARWADGRFLTETFARVSADATLVPDATGALAAVDLANWSVKAAAGSLEGTGGADRKDNAWTYRAAAKGEGPIGPLARTVAGLRGKPAQAIRGLWKLDARYDTAARVLNLTAGAANLEIPQEATPPKPDIRLADAKLVAVAAMTPDGGIEIRQADLTGPGIKAAAKGAVRLPSETDKKMSASGTAKADAKLTELAQLLLPFGVLPEGTQMKGAAAFDLEAKTTPNGFTAAGSLNLADVEARLGEAGATIRETKAQVPISVVYEQDKRRWDVFVKDMKGETASGTIRAALTETDGDPLLQARCDLTLDGKRLRDTLGKDLPPEVRFAGLWRVLASVAGPLASTPAAAPAAPAASGSPSPGAVAAANAKPPEIPWNRRIAGLTGEGSFSIDRFEYQTLTGGKGDVYWRLAEGQIVLGQQAAGKPSRLTLAGGTLNLGGRILLRDTPPRLIVTERLQVVEGLPVGGEEVQGYLKYASPVLAASVSAKGRFAMTLDSLDLPLGEGAAKKAAATGSYRIDDFQTELIGPLGRLLQVTRTQTQMPPQPFGPVEVRMADGVLHIKEHDLQYAQGVRLRFGGTIGVDKQMNVVIGIPLTEQMLTQFKVTPAAMPYLKDTVMAVPLTGTIDKPQLDEKAVGKRLAELALEAIKRQTLERLGDWIKGATKPK